MAGSRAFSTFPAITLLIFELQTSRSEQTNRTAEIYQMAGSRAFSSFSYVCLICPHVRLLFSLRVSFSSRSRRNKVPIGTVAELDIP